MSLLSEKDPSNSQHQQSYFQILIGPEGYSSNLVDFVRPQALHNLNSTISLREIGHLGQWHQELKPAARD